MSNVQAHPSGLCPVGHAILVEAYEEEKKEKSLIQLPDQVKQRLTAINTKVRVLAVGSEAWAEESQPRADVGDVVLISMMAGSLAEGPLDAKSYRLINDRDIFCVLHLEEKANV